VKQVRVHGPHDVRVDEIDEPRPGERDAVVRIAACGICGSDLKYISMGFAGPGGAPMPLGHEMSGTVEWVGSVVTGVAVGDRVVVHPGNDDLGRIGNGSGEGGLAPRLLVRDVAGGGRLHPVPDDLDLTVAALAEPLAVGLHAVDQAGAGPDDRVVIFGCGPIGLAALATLVDRGNERVIAVDLSERRRRLALELGALDAIDPAEGRTWERIEARHGTDPFMFGPVAGTDVFIEASGAAPVIADVIDHAKIGARLTVVALHTEDIPVSFLMVLMKQLTIRGAMEYPDAGLAPALDLLERRDLSSLITHRFDLDRFDEALALLAGSRDCGKVMITIPETDGAAR
jgi:threonine dehydrogenase-like Zn-dependent dehydrogenase